MDLTSALGISYVEFVQRFAQQMELERFSHDCVAVPRPFLFSSTAMNSRSLTIDFGRLS